MVYFFFFPNDIGRSMSASAESPPSSSSSPAFLAFFAARWEHVNSKITTTDTRTHLFFFLPFLLLSQASDPRVKLFYGVASTSRRLQLLWDISKSKISEMKRGNYDKIVSS
jgi:hypothetical protein